MTASSSSSSSAFSGYNFHPVTDLPSQTEWEFTTTDTKTATTTHYTNTSAMDDTDGDATMTMFPFEDSSGATEDLLSSLSRVTAVISPSSSTDSGEVNNSNVVVFGPHNWMDDENDEYYIQDDHNEETLDQPQPQQDAANDDLMARPLEDLFNNALYLENDDDENYLHQEQAAHQRRNNHDTSMMMIDDSQGFLAPLLNHVPEPNFVVGGVSTEHFNIGLPLEERYMVTLNKLEASMKRSMESRNCLTIQTSVTRQAEERRHGPGGGSAGGNDGNDCVDDRATTIREILSSITTSSNQVQKYVTSIAQHK